MFPFSTLLIRFCPCPARVKHMLFIQRANQATCSTILHFASKILILPLANRWIKIPQKKQNDAQHGQKQHLKFNEFSRSTNLVDWIPESGEEKKGPGIVILNYEPWLREKAKVQ